MGIQEEIDLLRSMCVGCGRCRKVCPSLKHGGVDPMAVMSGSEEGIFDCIACGNCSKTCRKTDPMVAIKDLVALRKGIHVSDVFRETGLAMPVSDMVVPEPPWEGDDVAVMSGCVVKCRAPFIEYAAAVAVRSMGFGCKELEGTTCCMHPVQFREMTAEERESFKAGMGRRARGSDLVTLCGGCNEEFEMSGIHSEHIIQFMDRHIGRLPRFGRTVKVALEPGCSAMAYAKEMEDVVRAMNCEPIGNTTGCCGKNVPPSVPLMEEREAECAGADLIVVGCPMCYTKYDSQPGGLPVVHIAELAAMAAGDFGSMMFHKIPFRMD